ncbi:MAG: hypothetical protein CVU43_18590 [Chloroflexi bacterium HGW-Chloroflexi-5]|nr:MAG: hypothetical protein CVU43_18590 [Chloroflexi bacterium HGW-Chloroflexi-5]
MKCSRLALALLFFVTTFSLAFAGNCSIQSLLGVPFGQVCTISGKFVEKPASYYAQNVSLADYYLEVGKINGQALAEPLLVEPVCEGFKPESGKVYDLKAYETVESQNEPENWSEPEIARQFSYSIVHRIVLRLL